MPMPAKYKVLSVVILLIVAGLTLLGAYKNSMGKKIFIAGHAFKAEFAITPQEKAKGLGSRASLCSDCSMVFPFDRPSIHPFWMKDMQFDLDIIWVKAGRIVYMAKNSSHLTLQVLDPKLPADMVVEINAGLADKYSLKIGDSVAIK